MVVKRGIPFIYRYRESPLYIGIDNNKINYIHIINTSGNTGTHVPVYPQFLFLYIIIFNSKIE